MLIFNLLKSLFSQSNAKLDSNNPHNISTESTIATNVTNTNSQQTEQIQENINFYENEFSKFGKKGIVAMQVEGWGDAWGHITLWNGEKFLDDNKGGDKNYLIKVDG